VVGADRDAVIGAAVEESEESARRRDDADPGHRELFDIPPAGGGRYAESAYLLGNSLGLPPRTARAAVLTDVDAWARFGVHGHFEGERPWLSYPEAVTGPMARLVGAKATETAVMGALTVNLHLLMVSFYRPAGERTRIVVEEHAFPSDSHAVRSQVRAHGLDPDLAVVRVPTVDIADHLAREGPTVALVLLGGINYLTGELLDIPAITAAGHAAGATVGWDLAHAAGNVPLRMHDWGADFAAWCSYKYLNAGPGALAGLFVHERHLGDRSRPRFEGWWGTELATRFEMAPVARPPATAEAWQVSNPPIFSMAPVRASLEIFEKVGMAALRARSVRLTGYLAALLDRIGVEVVTPREAARRGCQLSLRLPDPDRLVERLRHEYGVDADARPPDILRLAPVPLYSTYHDCWRSATALGEALRGAR
jgi:kynureninase